MNILLCGDSFAADWTVKDPTIVGWPNLLSNSHNIKNIASAGSSEYRIWKSLQKQTLSDYDFVIVSHTSPYRIYVNTHPIHQNNSLHKNCDLIYSDAIEHNLTTIKDYFENYFDLDHAIDIHQLIMLQISSFCNRVPTIHIQHMETSAPPQLKVFDFSPIWNKHRGVVNHYDNIGNQLVYKTLMDMLK